MNINIKKEEITYCSGDLYINNGDEVEIGIFLKDGSKIEIEVDENKLELLEIAIAEAKKLLSKKEIHKKELQQFLNSKWNLVFIKEISFKIVDRSRKMRGDFFEDIWNSSR